MKDFYLFTKKAACGTDHFRAFTVFLLLSAFLFGSNWAQAQSSLNFLDSGASSNLKGNFNIFAGLGDTVQANPGSNTTVGCDEFDVVFAPTVPDCNGIAVTSVNFFKSQRIVASGTDNTVGVTYRYVNAGTAPDGTVIDALVTIPTTGYTNTQDVTDTTFRDADLFVNPDTGNNVGFDNNLQPSLEPETNLLLNANPWSGSITYRIQFVRTGTNIPKTISVAATTFDNDGSGICGGLKESVTYSSVAPNSLNQTLINNPTGSANFQVQSGNTFTPNNNTVQAGIGIGVNYASSALYINVTEMSWTYSFQTAGACTTGGASEDRFGSLNMNCRTDATTLFDFQKDFVYFPLSGTVFNDTDGRTDNQVDGTGTNAGGLFANLLDGNGNVYASVPVSATDGTYSFPRVVPGNFTVQISVNQGIESSPAPIKILPPGWTNTAEKFGAGTGDDGTIDGLLAVTVSNAAVTLANFGIEQRPTTSNSTTAIQTNPGGTTSVTVPPASFVFGDLSGGTVSSIRITALPSNANSITIGGTTYTTATFPAAGVTIPVTGGVPSQAISVDPIDGAVTVGIPFVAIDNAGLAGVNPSIVNVPFGGPSISGNVFNDLNGLTDSTVNGTGTNTGSPLYAVLVNGSGNVVQSVLVSAGGNYNFPGVAAGNYTVRLSTTAGTVGSAAPAANLPAGWVSTGEFLGAGAGNDGTPANTQLSVTVAAANITNANFGIEQRPTANSSILASQAKPAGTTNVTVPAVNFSGSDPVSSTIASIRITALPAGANTITINGITYGTAAGAGVTLFPAAGVTVPTNALGNPTQTITVDPLDAAAINEVEIQYVAIDQAGVVSPTATVTIPFGTATISGTVFNDVNGSTDLTVNGTGTNTGSPLFALLVNTSNNTISQSIGVSADGTYSFSGLAAGTYTVQLSTTAGTVGGTAPAAATLPTGWVNTAQYPSLDAGNDGTNDGKLTPFTIAAGTNVVNANFGIEQPPTANNRTAAVRTNPGGNNTVTVPASTFNATDPVTNVVSSIRITTFPTNTTTITINGIVYGATAGAGVTAFPAGGVTTPTNAFGEPTTPILINPVDGSVTAVITYVAIDQAGVASLATATASVPFTTSPTSATGDISGTLIFEGKPLRNALVVLVSTQTGTRAFTRTDADGDYAFRAEVGRTYLIQPMSSKYSFSPSTSVVNMVGSVAGLDFASSEKAYRPKNDFDGDGKTDAAVFRPTNGNWYVLKSGDGQMSVFNFGLETDRPVSADFDGDGKTDYAVFRPSTGTWYIWQSATQNLRAEQFGLGSDKLVPADYDGDGKDDIAVYRSGVWYVRRSSDNAFDSRSYGIETDTPMTGDFDADGKADLAVYRSAEGNWFTLQSSNNQSVTRKFGVATDVPAAADFDGDGYDDIAQFRNGLWYVLNSTTQFEFTQFGTGEDRSIVGDFDGDGRADQATFSQDGLWSVRNSGDGTTSRFYFGLSTDITIQ